MKTFFTHLFVFFKLRELCWEISFIAYSSVYFSCRKTEAHSWDDTLLNVYLNFFTLTERGAQGLHIYQNHLSVVAVVGVARSTGVKVTHALLHTRNVLKKRAVTHPSWSHPPQPCCSAPSGLPTKPTSFNKTLTELYATWRLIKSFLLSRAWLCNKCDFYSHEITKWIYLQRSDKHPGIDNGDGVQLWNSH